MPLCGNKVQEVEDPIIREKIEYEKFKQTVAMLRKMIENYHTELAKLNPMHDEFIRHLNKFTEGTTDASQRERILRDAEITGGVKTAFESSKTQYQDLVVTMDRLQVEMANLDSKLKERDAASIKRNHYMKKVDKIKARESMVGSPKMERNLKKYAEADAKYDDIDSFTCRELRRFMDQRFSFVEQVVHEHTEQLRKYYADASGNMFKAVIIEAPVPMPIQGPVKPVIPLSPASPISPTSPMVPVAGASQSSSLIEPATPSMMQSPLVPVIPMTPHTPIAVVVEESPKSIASPKKSGRKSKTAPQLNLSVTSGKEESVAVNESIKLPPASSLETAVNEEVTEKA
jgi:hypothetical protein